MKALGFLLIALGLAAAIPSLPAAQPNPAAPGAPLLQVQIKMPPDWKPMLESRVEDAFIAKITEVFERSGYRGNIGQVSASNEAGPGIPLLTIDLNDWRMDYIGHVECTFTATLQIDRQVRHLGAFSGLALRWMDGPGPFGMSQSFSQAAEDALRRLYDALVRTQLLPGAQKH